MKKLNFIIVLTLFAASAAFAQNKIADGKSVKVLIGKKELVLVAATEQKSHVQGLSGKKKMPKDGMIFIFASARPLVFWMKDMNFAIDIVWVKENEILGFAQNAQPEPKKADYLLRKYFSPQDADAVIELNAGDVEKFNIKEGDKIIIDGVF
ncbi:MAG: DUF192 domain-containing protein [Endomicrobium sp.]|nr:DUF192 domain-containing protein [Endomicrobium sp.]